MAAFQKIFTMKDITPKTMPDITMCKGVGCEAKETCYRYTAEPSYMQSCFLQTPSINGKCNYYIKHITRKQE